MATFGAGELPYPMAEAPGDSGPDRYEALRAIRVQGLLENLRNDLARDLDVLPDAIPEHLLREALMESHRRGENFGDITATDVEPPA